MTVEELIEQYRTDEELRQEVAAILADGKVTMLEGLAFARRHDVRLSLNELPRYVELAQRMGFSVSLKELSKYVDLAKKLGFLSDGAEGTP